MTYDVNGNYYFDPTVDGEDQEMVQEAHKKALAEDYVKQQHALAKQQHQANEIVAEILDEEGIDQQTYQQLLENSPDVAKEAFRTATQHLVRSVKKGGPVRDKKTGQYVKRETELDRRDAVHHAVDPERLNALKETAKTRSLTDTESEEAIDALLGKLI